MIRHRVAAASAYAFVRDSQGRSGVLRQGKPRRSSRASTRRARVVCWFCNGQLAVVVLANSSTGKPAQFISRSPERASRLQQPLETGLHCSGIARSAAQFWLPRGPPGNARSWLMHAAGMRERIRRGQIKPYSCVISGSSWLIIWPTSRAITLEPASGLALKWSGARTGSDFTLSETYFD